MCRSHIVRSQSDVWVCVCGKRQTNAVAENKCMWSGLMVQSVRGVVASQKKRKSKLFATKAASLEREDVNATFLHDTEREYHLYFASRWWRWWQMLKKFYSAPSHWFRHHSWRVELWSGGRTVSSVVSICQFVTYTSSTKPPTTSTPPTVGWIHFEWNWIVFLFFISFCITSSFSSSPSTPFSSPCRSIQRTRCIRCRFQISITHDSVITIILFVAVAADERWWLECSAGVVGMNFLVRFDSMPHTEMIPF